MIAGENWNDISELVEKENGSDERHTFQQFENFVYAQYYILRKFEKELVCETFMNSFLSLVLSGFMHSLFYLFKDKRGDFLQTSTESMKPNGNTEQELIENCHVYQLDLKLNL